MKFNIIKICYDIYLVFYQPNKPYMNDINKKKTEIRLPRIIIIAMKERNAVNCE